MLVLGIGLSVIGLGFFCWLLFNLAVYALPFFAGLTAGLAAYHSGAGIVGGILVGFFAGAVLLALGQVAFATVRSPLIRAAIALLFAAPATVARYHATLGVAHIGVPSEAWREVFAVIGAVVAGVTAWVRMMVFAEPLLVQGETAGPPLFPLTARSPGGELRHPLRLPRSRGQFVGLRATARLGPPLSRLRRSSATDIPGLSAAWRDCTNPQCS